MGNKNCCNSSPAEDFKGDEKYMSSLGKVIDNIILVLIPYPQGAVYGHLSGIKQNVGEEVDDFCFRFEKEFKIHSGTTFNDDPNNAYQQQLKNALLSSFWPEIGGWVRKHFVEVETAPVSQLMTWACHAEKGVKKTKTGPDVFHLGDLEESETSAFSQGPYRGRGRGRGGYRG